MTNTPMTFEEWLVQEIADHHENNDKDMIKHLIANLFLMQKAWQACQSHNDTVIAELVEALEDARAELSTLDRRSEYVLGKVNQTIAKVKGE